jgi:protein TonB
MISALLFAAAAGNFVPPSFTPNELRELQESYPEAALDGGKSAAAVIDARVDRKGRITDCKITASYGDKDLAQTICGLVERIRIEPASVGGDPSYGVVRHIVRLMIDDSEGAKIRATTEPADLELQVTKLPAGQRSLRVNANVLIDAAGKPQACYAVGDVPQAYADVACSQVAGLGFGILNDDGGKPVRFVSNVIVDFDLASPSAASAG